MRDIKSNWNLALCLSLMIHLTVFVVLPRIILKNNIVDTKNKPKEIEIITKTIKKSKIPAIHKEYENMMPKEPPPPYLNNLINKVFVANNTNINMDKPMILNNNLKDIILAKLPKEKELKKNPAYMDYYHLIREKIRSKAYHYYNSNRQGQILLTFIISNTGNLEGLYLNNTSPINKDLVEISLKSIKESSPFPPFPTELKYLRLQFNISIYFKNN